MGEPLTDFLSVAELLSVTELLSVAEIAVTIETNWRSAYDKLLSGAFGRPVRRGRSWYARADGVGAYLVKQAARHA